MKLILQVLQKCKQYELTIKLTKYEFYKKKLIFLGHIVSRQDIKIDKNYIKDIAE